MSSERADIFSAYFDSPSWNCASVSRLIEAPGLPPLKAQVRIMQACRDDVARAGLKLPRQIHVKWKFGAPDSCQGACKLEPDGRITLYLAANVDPVHLQEMLYHELCHASQYHLGRQHRMTRGDMEREAFDFAARMMSMTSMVFR